MESIMQATVQAAPASKTGIRIGLILTAIPTLFLLFDSTIHILKIQPVVESAAQLGYSVDVIGVLGFVELICLALYVIPRTSVFGAVLLTGYLGGAISTNLRIGAPLFSNVLFPVYVALMLWGGLYLRDARLRALFPLRSPKAD
jgi:hypothetical protein